MCAADLLFEKDDPNNWMVKHVRKEHEGNKDDVEFTWKVLRKHSKPIQRQLHEAVRLNNKTDEENLNSKSEYLSQRIVRINLDKRQTSYHCQTCGLEAKAITTINEHVEMFHTKKQCENCELTTFGTRAMIEHLKICTKKNESQKV